MAFTSNSGNKPAHTIAQANGFLDALGNKNPLVKAIDEAQLPMSQSALCGLGTIGAGDAGVHRIVCGVSSKIDQKFRAGFDAIQQELKNERPPNAVPTVAARAIPASSVVDRGKKFGVDYAAGPTPTRNG